MTRYCVIGAGAAGISALEQLRKAGYEVDCFEKTDRVGGHWHTDYDSLHLITSRDMTSFEGFPMPADYPHFPRRDQVRTYIESYAREHGHYEIIRFETGVVSVVPVATDRPVGSAGWTVTLDTGERIDYDGVFVANGHLWDPNVPDVPGTFTGKQIHSGSYRNTGDLEGERLLVVGAGNSGCDLAVDAAQHLYDVDIVIRSGVHFQPKSYFGRPRQQVSFLSQFSPDEQDLVARLLARVSIGEWKDYPGMPEPESRTLAGGRVVVNDLLLYWIQHGRVRVVPGISRFDGTTVHFTDGADREYDTILWATGFRPSLPFLDASLVQRRERGAAALRRRRRARGPREAVLHRPRRTAWPADQRVRRAGQARDPARRAARVGRRGRRGARGLPVGAPDGRRPDRHHPRGLGCPDGGHRAFARRLRTSASLHRIALDVRGIADQPAARASRWALMLARSR